MKAYSKRRFLLLGSAALLVSPFYAWAQQTPANQAISVRAPERLVAKRGSTVSQTLELTIRPGFHVNSDKPKEEFLIPLKLAWDNGPLEAQKVSYPSPEEVKVGPDTLRVFTGTFHVRTEFQVSANANPGLAIAQAKLHYQACDDVSCKRPATLTIQVPVSIR